MRRLVLAGVVALASCQCAPPPTEGAIRVVVRFEGYRPGCLEVSAADHGGKSWRAQLGRAELEEKRSASVSVVRSIGGSADVDLVVRAFEQTCAGSPLEEYRTQRTFLPGQVLEWQVALEAVDADDDGFASSQHEPAGTDCDDSDPATRPGGVERCDGKDGDCNGRSGCAEPACASSGPSLCQSPPSECHRALGSCASDGRCTYAVDVGKRCGQDGGCRSDGTCIVGEFLCDDGRDDDADGLRDCADPDCLDQTCREAATCNFNGRCVADGGCREAGGPCNSPPDGGQCFNLPGTCQSSQCVFTVAQNRACNDGDACTLDDRCDGQGRCTSTTPETCNAPPSQCLFRPPMCTSPVGCVWLTDAGAWCDDGQATTFGDRCLADGGCQGTPCNCPQTACTTASSCLPDGGCNYVVSYGKRCDGGFCGNDGACVDPSPFPYLPQNFLPSMHMGSGQIDINNNCQVVFDSTDGGWATAGCSSPPSRPNLRLNAAGDAVVLSMARLNIASSSSLRLVGDKPVILAVYGDALIQGPIYAHSSRDAGFVGAGALSAAACGLQAGLNGRFLSGGGGGGGGAGNGTAGAPGGAAHNDPANAGDGGIAGPAGPRPLRGGCPGGIAGGGAQVSGGEGGGAVQISAAGTLELDSIVTASGMGGEGARQGSSGNDPGGGGGGSGGMVVLEASFIKLTSNAKVTANGGAGGGGADNNAAQNGEDGRIDSSLPAQGGSKEGMGGNGGSGGAGTTPPVAGTASNKGGGGGGGAFGQIFITHHADGGQSCQEQSLSSPPAVKRNCP